jgi:cysteine-rich repeat protein
MKSTGCNRLLKLLSALLIYALTATYAVFASALEIPFSDTAGFSANAPASVVRLLGGAPLAGRGGLEFSNAVTVPPGDPLGAGTAPPNIWKGVAWGCAQLIASPSTCANAGVIGNGINFGDPAAKADRSAFVVEGKFGTLNDTAWTDVAAVTHFNKTINAQSNVLKAVNILSYLRLGASGSIVDTPSPATISIAYKETINDALCRVLPAAGAPVNPLRSNCDDYAIIASLDLAPVFLPIGAAGNAAATFIDFRLAATPASGALICDGSPTQPAACGGYRGASKLIYTAERSINRFSLQARLRPANPPTTALFVIGDVEPHAVGNTVNFWGAQWWTNNAVSGPVSSGVASFIGYANKADDFCGGKWESRPGNNSNPPATIPDDIAVIVTSSVQKNGTTISGNIKQIVTVHSDGLYAPAAGQRGSGTVTSILCPVLPPICGDGLKSGPEQCDDGNTLQGDGCSAVCSTESGYTCTGSPSVCTANSICGNGLVSGPEQCDDGNALPGDGCSASCTTESGFTCAGSPSVCSAINVCGNGIVTGAEQCDDGNTNFGDGCSVSCTVESGFSCTGSPSVCTANSICGNGIVTGAEQCDDANPTPGDGCSTSCTIESGFTCAGSPSLCTVINACGNGILQGGESCDDGNVGSGDGCSAICTVENGFSCSGSPSICGAICGDGFVASTEQCDDGNFFSGDGCDANCSLTACGNGIITGGEQCDDGNTIPGDGCSAVCQSE